MMPKGSSISSDCRSRYGRSWSRPREPDRPWTGTRSRKGRRNNMVYFGIFLSGMVIGIANAIPGVSGGTMAVVLNVYDRLIALVSLNLKKILRDLPFALLLVAGAGTGIILFAKLMSGLFDSYPVPTTWFFMGLIVGSIPFVARRTRGTGSVPVKTVL